MKQVLLKTWLIVVCLLCGVGTTWATDVTYTITSKSAVSTSGTAPSRSSATFANTYSTKDQMTSGNTMTLTLSGYAGKKITGVTLSMHSNKSAGAGYLSVVAGTTTLASIGSTGSGVAFNNASWNGSYIQTYTDVTPTMSNSTYAIKSGEDVVLVIGCTTNSLFCQSFKISYADAGGSTPDPGAGGGDSGDSADPFDMTEIPANTYVTYDFSVAANYTPGFPTSGTNVASRLTATFGGNSLIINAPDSYYEINSTVDATRGLFFGKSATSGTPAVPVENTAYLEFPAKAGYKISKIHVLTTNGCASSINTNIFAPYSSGWTAVSTLQGTGTSGTERLLKFNLTNSNVNTPYCFLATNGNKNLQMRKIKVEYTPVGPAEIPNLIKTSSADLYVGDGVDDLNTYLNLPNDYAGIVTFSSEQDGTLVTLVGEMLSADAAGTATINVSAAANGNYLETAGTITLNISKKTPVIAWTNDTKGSYTIFDVNENKFIAPTAYLTTAGPAINYSVSGSEDDVTIDEESGELVWVNPGTYVVTAQTEETDEYNASNVLTYTINVVEPTISMTPVSGTVSAENPTVTFTGNGVKIDYINESEASDEKNGTTISVEATTSETYYVGITDDAGNTFNDQFDVYFLQDANLLFSAPELRVVVGTTEVVEPVLSKATDAAVTYELIYGDPEKGANVATIDPATGKLTLAGKSTETQGSVTVKATTPATAEYTAGEATYELVVYRNVPSFTWTAASVTIDQDELNLLPTPICERNVTSLTSSNTAVATIVDGAVTFVGYGTTTITGKTTATADYAQATASYELTFAPRYTVTFNVNGEETELREATTGAGVTAPVVEDIADYTFAGWASTAVAEETTDAQTFATITAGKYMPTTNTTLYAVYQRVEESEGGSDDEGEFLIYANVNGTKYYMTGKPTASNSTTNQVTVTTNRAEAYAYTIAKKGGSTDQYSIAYDDNGVKYLNCTRTGSSGNYNYYLQSNSTEYYFTFSDGAKDGTTRMLSTYSNRAIAFDNNANPKVFKIFSTTNITPESTQYFDPTLEQISGGSTTYYTSTPVLEVANINVSQYKNTTLCISRAYTMPEGLVGKTISASEGSDGVYNLTLTTKYNEGDVVPAGEALVVQGAQGTYHALAAASSESKTAYPENLLVAEYTPQDAKFLTSFDSENSDDYYYYKLTTKDGANFGWYYGADGGVPFLMSSKERAYLVIAKNIAQSIRAFRLEDIEESTTAIDTVETINNETIFNLQGQRMNRIHKGVNIINGKKVIR